MLAVTCVIAILENTLYVRAALDEQEQIHDGNDEEGLELQIGESPVHSGYGKKININQQLQSEGSSVKKGNSMAIERKLFLVGGDEGSVKVVNVESSLIGGDSRYQKHGKGRNNQHRGYKLRNKPENHFDGRKQNPEAYEPLGEE